MAINIALAGNPNCGKTTMFNDLTGANQYVGNWPGVTVEKKEGRYRADKGVVVTDLPGVYSLSPYTPEEIVTRDYLMSGKPDAVINWWTRRTSSATSTSPPRSSIWASPPSWPST